MANEQFVSRYRKYGEEQPYWKAGIFKIRLPFIHYAWSIPEMVQAVFMCATCLGAIPVLTEVLGVSYEVALSMVIINGFFYNLHVLLGDPVVPGWITPAIPLITAFLEDGYAIGPERTQALIAMQLILGVIFLVFGITGIGGKMVHLVPNSVKAGVLMGGGLSAIIGEISATTWLAAIPTAIVVYIIAFGDFVTSEELIASADEIRQDEKIDFNANRSNVISGIRNVAMAICCPYTQTCGPLWAAVTAAVSQRYKEGPKAMESIYSGAGTFRWSTFVCVALIPISSLLQPVLPVALSLTLIVQGFICTQLAMNMCRTDIERGICGVMGAVLAIQGAAWGLAVGLILFFLLFEGKKNEQSQQAAVSASSENNRD